MKRLVLGLVLASMAVAARAQRSVKDFHTAVLWMGPLPLDILEQEVDCYIRSRA